MFRFLRIMASSDKKEELMEVVVYTGGTWIFEDHPAVEYPAVYDGATIKKHNFKMPVKFTCSMLHEYVENAMASPLQNLTYLLPSREMESPVLTFFPVGAMSEEDVDIHFRDHLTRSLALGRAIEVYHYSD
ncbi:hypothetical protein R6Q59_015428 [Mikania micrantha]